MIETKLLKKYLPIVYHCITEFVDEDKTARGVKDAIHVIDGIIKNKNKFNLILEVKPKSNSNTKYNMAAHRIWAVGFKENEKVIRNVIKIAVVGADSLKFRGEKEYMETENVKYFYKLEEARIWVKS